MHAYMDILIRTVLSILVLLLIAKMLGKQTISNMTFHDFVTGITLGAIAANLAFNETIKLSYLILSLIVITVTSYLLSVIALKSRKMRNWISGSPTVLIEGGKILEDNMRKVRYTLDSLDQALREKGVFDIEEVDYAVLEDNGVVSVLKKDEYKYVTKKDMKLLPNAQVFPIELIMDGKMMEKNLENNGLTKEWLELELKRKGKKLSDVFYAARGTKQQLVFDFYEDGIHQTIDKE
ncbi:uncharacterized membrane protein YcaP (DUF421 family) [Paenibacillus sp. V4I3]|uniref:DUF421 domain-containing protein n=1 Tax=unclassified Paenibacillus TaxID=185978 RepID=UPI002782F4F9|nr:MULTISPECIES: DUF421 domain-containing protein [unclassified Paenibacillus]MDQ0872350.1 uncharacterized membrane protein YcaP (DUF421 family) [Paenibacillus sp. V4I3]MDQ0891765.1 uncharacterized membrane protein YcaP (DUF421 family) [Paenibacillus sp. V4I9]